MTGASTASGLRTCGVRIDALARDQAAQWVVATAGARPRPTSGASVHLCNAYTLSLTSRDPELAALIDGGTRNLMDGMPLVWTARRLGFEHIDERVYGPDLMLDVMHAGVDGGLRHYLYGGAPDVVADLEERLRVRVPGVRIVGAESPPYRPLTGEEEDEVAARFMEADADVVWVGLGTPKQDVFVERFKERVPAVFVAVGAAFDFHAGRKRQAPEWMQRAGLEWLFRLLSEPRRLWRRYLIGNLVFLWGLSRGVEVVELPEE